MPVRIKINDGQCVGAGQCALTAPGVFDQDDEGFVTVVDATPSEDQHEAVRLAADVCPSQSIVVIESD